MGWIARMTVRIGATFALVGVFLGYGAPIFHALDAIGHFRLHFLFLALVMILPALILRTRGALWRSLVAALIAVAGLSPLWEGESQIVAGRTVMVMTANLHHQNARSEEMVAALRSADADILVTNETTTRTLTADDPLSGIYPHRLSLSTSGNILRTVIWSKFPLRDGALFLEDQVEPTGAAAIARLPDGQEITILGLHLAHAFPGNQDRQIAALDEIATNLPRPLIVLGDFNAAPWSHAIREVEKLTGTRRIPGYRVTWRGAYPSPFGEIPSVMGHAIDHVLLSPGMGARNIEVVSIPGSDHRAIGVTVTLPGPSWAGFAQLRHQDRAIPR